MRFISSKPEVTALQPEIFCSISNQIGLKKVARDCRIYCKKYGNRDSLICEERQHFRFIF